MVFLPHLQSGLSDLDQMALLLLYNPLYFFGLIVLKF
jgi:hypothetical protein